MKEQRTVYSFNAIKILSCVTALVFFTLGLYLIAQLFTTNGGNRAYRILKVLAWGENFINLAHDVAANVKD